MPEISLDYLNACKLLLPSYDQVVLVLVGCGGTGSWLAPSVARVARLLVEKFQKTAHVYFIDPDTVEAKNCYRQNFCPAEIGRNKAEALAFRYGLAWGLEIIAIPQVFKGDKIPRRHVSLEVFIGCVDGAGGRVAIQDAVYFRSGGTPWVWWLDCGNHQAAGQVLLGCGAAKPKDPFELPGHCTWLPLPSKVHPELLEPQPEYAPDTSNLSCADLAMLDSQGLAINQRIAAEATDYLVRMLLTKDLCKWGTYIDLASGSARSNYITKDQERD